jgi:metal-sulfur cluster biosynthetic enzyme
VEKSITNEDVMKVIEPIEHPEITATLVKLGMMLDANVQGNKVNVAMALPMYEIPEAVRNILVESIRKSIENLGLELNVHFFEMTKEVRDNFFAVSRANWKESI